MNGIQVTPELLKAMGLSEYQIQQLTQAATNTCTDFVLRGSVRDHTRYSETRDYFRRIRASRHSIRAELEEKQRLEDAIANYSLVKGFGWSANCNLLPAPRKTFWKRNDQIKFFPYQESFCRWAVQAYHRVAHNSRGKAFQQKGVYNQDETGLGKTFQAIESAVRIQEESGSTQPILIIVPKRAVTQWARALKRYIPNAVIRKEPTEIDEPYFIITWYENIRKFFPVKGKEDESRSLQAALNELDDDDDLFENPWDLQYACVITDEAHRLRDTGTQVWKAFKQVRFDFLIALSATPYHRDPAQMYPLLNKMQPAAFSSEFQYQMQYTAFRYGNKANGIKDYEKFTKDHEFVLRKRTKLMVRPDHPDDFESEVILEMNERQAEFYQDIKDHRTIESDFNEMDFKAITNVLAEMVRAQQCTSLPMILGKKIDSVKMEWMKERIDEILDSEDTETQFLIYTKFVAPAQEIAAILREKGERVAVLDGNAEGDIGRQFQTGAIRWLVSTLASGSTALDFREVAHVDTIFYDVDWSYIKMKQAIGRTTGITSPEPRNLTFILCKGTIDEIVYTCFKDGVTDQETLVKRLLESNAW
jgi:SNF2 family DNA or RNA helicase